MQGYRPGRSRPVSRPRRSRGAPDRRLAYAAAISCQLRIYSIRSGRLEEFTEFWRAEIVPLRRRFGFAVRGAWCDPQASTFAWVLAHPDFAAAEASYYESPDRAGLSRDPAEFIERSELRMMESVDAG